MAKAGGLLSLLAVNVLAFAKPALATTNLFIPVSGTAFVSDDNAPNVKHVNGEIISTDNVARTVEASVGHAAGGTNGFTIYGFGNGAALTCSVVTNPSIAGNTVYSYPTSGPASTSVFGFFSFFIETTPPSGDYFYNVECVLPAENGGWPAFIYGVKPDH